MSLPRWAYAMLALATGIIGIASSYVTARFFIFGLNRLETDDLLRESLISAGVLMTVTELAAFFVAALLPRHQLRALRFKLIASGLVLLAFESVTIYATQVAVFDAVTAEKSQSIDLRLSIDNQRATANALRKNGMAQSESTSAWTRQLGAASLAQAATIERELAPTLANIGALNAKPSLADVLGKQGVVIYSVSRAMLISIMGIVMFGASGVLARAASESTPESTVISAPLYISTDDRYLSIRNGVQAGVVKPSVRGLQLAAPIGTLAARTMLTRLESDGVIARVGKTWALRP